LNESYKPHCLRHECFGESRVNSCGFFVSVHSSFQLPTILGRV
jgi:hypothetical protein